MKELLYYILVPILFVIYSIAYIWTAKKLNLVDNPVVRSSHISKTITGFGLFTLFGMLIFSIFFPYIINSFFIIGLVMLGVISYLDDIRFVSHFIRLIFQIFALVLMSLELPFTNLMVEKWPIILACVLFGILVLNAFNFIDGINGMLGLNCLVILLSLWWLNEHLTDIDGNRIEFIKPEFIYTFISGLSVFLFLNLRRKAIVFLGDAGSITLAFIIFYLMILLVFKTGNIAYFLLFSVLGVDTGLTVIYKLILKENIFVPHRDFLFKKLVHVGRIPHVKVSFIYAAVQAFVSIFVILLPLKGKLSGQLSILFIFIFLLCATYISVRNKYTKQRIVKMKSN